MSGGFRVQRKQCKTCIYRANSPLDIQRLEAQVKDEHMGFKGYRVCHHGPGRGKNMVCCRGFWDRHKDEFALGQIAQRLDLVEFVTVDTLR